MAKAIFSIGELFAGLKARASTEALFRAKRPPLRRQKLCWGPGEVFFAEEDLQDAFGGEDVDGEAAFP